MISQRKVDHQRMIADARTIRENISRARGYLRRDELFRCIESANDALVLKSTGAALGMGRSEVDLLFSEMCDEFSRHPRVVAFLEGIGVTGGQFLRYKPGDETLLIKKLTAFRIKMEELEQREKDLADARHSRQREEWLQLGREHLRQKSYPKGKVYLRRVAETYGEEPDVLREVGTLFLEAGLLTEATEMFAAAIERFPSDQQAWRLAIDAADGLGEFKKAEALYLDAVKVFGGHPMTFLNIAKFYMKWNRKDDAYDYAIRALDQDPNLAEAIEIRNKMER
ncbi:tetratricopeptide repeat protein [Solidesulfovibrio sp.]|jgi:tetratricopeptide (TPR) repeat protein|uniref:tetratricopeptide repeat protein n=1 Tax=Solidesulfovibrio sp. TaxID=2910990 RepID=UPI002B1F47A7|nr:tetratricopeptide repeat protein [Solidesulfovibrio sp.]MEA5091021.1 tetratricopeptide repeat protein [Solidesulfovibrio sp.]HML62997.1 tetratricopeptide repeat protein [Solidesulfovibrio sp.]